jgi:hypothetical protein
MKHAVMALKFRDSQAIMMQEVVVFECQLVCSGHL